MNNVKVILLALVLFFVSQNIYAQKEPTFRIKVKLDIENGDLKSSLITITKNGAPFKVIDPNGGKYTVDLELGTQYQVTCTKMGYISKSVIIDSHVPSGREEEDFALFKITVALQPQPKDEIVTYSQPVGRIQYTMEKMDFDYDKDYTQSALAMQKKAEETAVPVPKPPTPAPKPPPPPPPPPPVVEKSKPIPIVVEQPVYTHVEEKPLPHGVEVVPYTVPIVRDVKKKLITEDRKKITVVTVNINGEDIIYRREEYNWGGVYYYKGFTIITERTFAKETEE